LRLKGLVVVVVEVQLISTLYTNNSESYPN
jgi:hypothetical protein